MDDGSQGTEAPQAGKAPHTELVLAATGPFKREQMDDECTICSAPLRALKRFQFCRLWRLEELKANSRVMGV
ncbi:hypothetical protein WJX81_005878 [Elliptochloris bilobata]|uniref:Uncharacterized protein n=1 Tax=Elliptochloris bilobata TaxID=381761 RepID=A0AAW1RI24_9CHLO